MKDYIIQQFNSIGIDINGEAARKFVDYYNLIIEWNSKFNLTAIKDFEGVVLKHFIDSAYGIKYIKSAENLCDVGAGAGFPSIPLKILCPQITVTMIESIGKKVAFLNEAVRSLNLTKCICLNMRAEQAAKGEYREGFDVVTARAVASLNTLCEYCLPLVKKGGLFVAYKGSAEEEIQQAENAVKTLGGIIEAYDKYSLTGNQHNRSLIVIRKIKHTDKKYPRGKNKERLNPL